MNTETNTTHTDNGGKFYVVNAEGRLIGSSNKKRTKRDKAPKQPKKQPSQEELTHLEEAVWEDSKFRIKFLKFIQGWEQKNDTDEELDEFLDELPTMKERALFHCWTVLEWRPRADKKKVVFAKKNPYTTKKQRSQTA
jgi:hypothetical protein